MKEHKKERGRRKETREKWTVARQQVCGPKQKKERKKEKKKERRAVNWHLQNPLITYIIPFSSPHTHNTPFLCSSATMNNRDWVEAALMNQSVVAELLIRLKYSDPAPMRSSHGVAVDWSVRQRRSKQILKEKGEPARDSPSTPLSWRSATSASGGATDVEDSTRADKASDMRSKVC